MHILIAIIGIVFTIFFVIGTHEFAHFATARLFGVKVLRFSIGFGKSLLHWHDKSGTEYIIALIPLGGYVKMLDEREGNVPAEEVHLTYNRQSYYKRFLIVLAGPLMNLLCAFLLYWLIYTVGFFTAKPIINKVTPHSIAADAGIRGNQEIIKIDGASVASWTSIMYRVIVHIGDQDTVSGTPQDRKNKKIQNYRLDLTHWRLDGLTPDPLSSLGIIPLGADPKFKFTKDFLNRIKYSPIQAIMPALQEVAEFAYFNVILFGKIIVGKLSLNSLGGPITIFETASSALNYGWLPFVGFLAFLSASLGVINLFPIPGLDGGHLAIQTIEFIIQRPLPERLLDILYRLGFLLVIFVLIQALINDVLRMY